MYNVSNMSNFVLKELCRLCVKNGRYELIKILIENGYAIHIIQEKSGSFTSPYNYYVIIGDVLIESDKDKKINVDSNQQMSNKEFDDYMRSDCSNEIPISKVRFRTCKNNLWDDEFEDRVLGSSKSMKLVCKLKLDSSDDRKEVGSILCGNDYVVLSKTIDGLRNSDKSEHFLFVYEFKNEGNKNKKNV